MLTAADLRLHQALGIEPALLDRARVRRVDDREARELLGVTGRYGDLSGVVYPRIHPLLHQERSYRIRRDNPEIEKGRPKNKYLSSVDRQNLFFSPGAGPLLGVASVPLVWVESEKASLAIAAAAERVQRPLLAVAAGGCWGWKGRIGKTSNANGARVDEHGPLPDLDLIAWSGREVIILFDGNVATNSSVAAARARSRRNRRIAGPPSVV